MRYALVLLLTCLQLSGCAVLEFDPEQDPAPGPAMPVAFSDARCARVARERAADAEQNGLEEALVVRVARDSYVGCIGEKTRAGP